MASDKLMRFSLLVLHSIFLNLNGTFQSFGKGVTCIHLIQNILID